VLAGFEKLTPGTVTVGTEANPLDVGVTDPLGRIEATSPVGQGLYLNGPLGAQFNIGNIISGDAVRLSSDLGALIDGTVTGPGPISFVSGGTMTLTPKADVHATTLGIFLRAGGLVMQDAQRMTDNGETLDPKYVAGDAARIRVDVGNIDLETTGDALITGIETGNTTEDAIRVVSTAGRILDNGDTRLDIIADQGNAKLTISGALGVGDDPVDVRLVNLQATSGGVVDLAAEGPLNIVGITAGDRVLLSATGDITGDAVTSTGTGGTNPDQTISITSTVGSVTLASVTGQTDVAVAGQTGVSLGTLTSTGGSAAATSGAGDVALGTTTAGQNVIINAPAGAVTATSTTAGGGMTATSAQEMALGTATAGGDMTLGAGGDLGATTLTRTGGSAAVTSGAGDVALGTTTAGQNVIINAPAGAVTATSTTAGGGMTATSAQDMTLGTATTGSDMTLGAGGNLDATTLTSTSGSVSANSSGGDVNLGATTAGQNATFSAATGSVTATTTTAGGTLAATSAQDMTLGTATTGSDMTLGAGGALGATTLTSTGGNVSASSPGGDVAINSITAGGNVSAIAAGDVSVDTGGAGGSFVIASLGGNVDAGMVSANTVALSAAGSATADTLNVGLNLQLAGSTVSASVNGGAGPVGGSVTGFGGGMATDVNLTLSGAGGFTLGNFWTAVAIVDNPLGTLSIGNAIIGGRASFTNPQTLLLLDQRNKSLQSSDIQLYTAGVPFSLYLSGNHLTTEATVIHSSPSHEVASASGPNISAVQQGEDTLARITLPPSAPLGGEEGRQSGSPVTFTGTPVSTECQSEDDSACAR
jgi:hypothetical protein